MSGMRVYRALGDALRDGFQVYDKTPTGYLVRQRLNNQWQLAIVEVL